MGLAKQNTGSEIMIIFLSRAFLSHAIKSPPSHQTKLILILKKNTRQEALTITRLGIPLIICHLAIIGMGATDTIFSGWVSTENLAGLAIAASIWGALSVFIMGMCGATATIAAHYHGGGRYSRIGFQVHQTAWIGVAAIVLVNLVLLCSQFWLPAIQPAGPVTEIAWRYLTILSLGSGGFLVFVVLVNACEAVGDMTKAMAAYGLLFSLNAVFDYLLVFGKFGLPELGAIGCAWASVAAYWLSALAVVIGLQANPGYRRYHLFTKAWQPHWATIKKHLHISLPLAIGSGGEVFFFSSIALMVASFGPVAVAGHQVVLNYSSLVYMVPLGFSVAVCIRVAQLRGAGQQQGATFSAFTGVKIALAVALITMIFTVAARLLIAEIYSPDQQVQQLASQLLLVCVVYQLFDAVQVSSWGGLRGFGDTKIPMAMQLTAYWLCGFPLGYVLANILELGVFGYWWGIVIGLMIAAILLHARLHVVARRINAGHTPGNPVA